MTATVQLLPLFYPAGVQQLELIQLVLGALDPETLGHDVVSFEAEDGGTADRELAIPFLAGMDEVVVDIAELRLRAVADERSIDGWDVTRIATAPDVGYVVQLRRPGRLVTVTMDVPTFDGDLEWPGTGTDTVHAVLRPAEPDGAGFAFGPPIFAHPSYALGSDLYPPVLGGMTVTESAGTLKLRVPDVSGSAWLIQFATGEEATELEAHGYTSEVQAVTVKAACQELSIVVPGESGDPVDDVVLWSYPSPFLPDVGDQVVSFTPVAQKRLASALGGNGAGPTLPVPLRFSSAAGGKLAVTDRVLKAHYEVDPLAAVPMPLVLRGWTELPLSAPAGRRPDSARASAVVRHLGRELNAGSPLPPRAVPTGGVRVDGERWAASFVVVEPVSGALTDARVPVAAVSVLVEAEAGAELAIELRPDVAGSPGPPPPVPLVHQFETAVRGWIEVVPAAALELEPGPHWVAMRTTRGVLRWFADGPGPARISIDRGETWGDVDPRLVAAESPVVQLYHALPPLPEPLPRPALTIQLGHVVAAADLLVGAVRTDPREFELGELALPAAVLDAIAARAGTGRVDTVLSLFSRSVIELVLEATALTYDPVV